MNTDTGKIYRGIEIDEAIKRGEPVVPVSEEVARLVELGQAATKLTGKLAALAKHRKQYKKRRDGRAKP
jgi:hypothetical protein